MLQEWAIETEVELVSDDEDATGMDGGSAVKVTSTFWVGGSGRDVKYKGSNSLCGP